MKLITYLEDMIKLYQPEKRLSFPQGFLLDRLSLYKPQWVLVLWLDVEVSLGTAFASPEKSLKTLNYFKIVRFLDYFLTSKRFQLIPTSLFLPASSFLLPTPFL